MDSANRQPNIGISQSTGLVSMVRPTEERNARAMRLSRETDQSHREGRPAMSSVSLKAYNQAACERLTSSGPHYCADQAWQRALG